MELAQSTPEILEVFSVTLTATPEVYVLDMSIRDSFGEEYRADFVSIPDDPYGLGPAVRQWLVDNPDFPRTPYTPPPPSPYPFLVETLWSRMTENETEEFDGGASTASPLKTRKQFAVATSMQSDSELFAWVRNILVGLFGAARADEILAA